MITKIGSLSVGDVSGLTDLGRQMASSSFTPAIQAGLMHASPRVAAFTGIAGGLEASGLEDDERKALTEHYGIGDNSNLVVRNGLRTAIGGLGGIGAGYGAWHLLNSGLGIQDPFVSGALLGSLSLAGLNTGTRLASRYNKDNAHSIMVDNIRKGEALRAMQERNM